MGSDKRHAAIVSWSVDSIMRVSRLVPKLEVCMTTHLRRADREENDVEGAEEALRLPVSGDFVDPEVA